MKELMKYGQKPIGYSIYGEPQPHPMSSASPYGPGSYPSASPYERAASISAMSSGSHGRSTGMANSEPNYSYYDDEPDYYMPYDETRVPVYDDHYVHYQTARHQPVFTHEYYDDQPVGFVGHEDGDTYTHESHFDLMSYLHGSEVHPEVHHDVQPLYSYEPHHAMISDVVYRGKHYTPFSIEEKHFR